jgi:phage minor structural protein
MIYLKDGKTPLNFAFEDEIVQEANSTYQLTFKYPVTNPMWEDLTEETLLLADDLHGEQEFIIFEAERHHGYITIYANQVATLLNNYSITELSVNNASGDRVMRSLVSSIIRNHKFTFSSNIANTHSINLKNVTVATALFKDKHSILGQWGGDLIRDKYDIRLLSNGGAEKEALFMYKKNLKSYQQKKSIKDLRTRIHFTKTINSQKEGEKDKVIAVTVDSPLIGKYKNIYEGNLDVNDQDVVDEASLMNYAKQYYKTTLCDVIEENIEIDVIGRPDVPVRIFDTVTIFHEKFNFDVKKKITKYTFSPMGKKLKTIGFGKIQQGLGTTLASMIDDVVAERVEESKVDAFKIQKNLKELMRLEKTDIMFKMKDLEAQAQAGVEVKRALFEKDGTVPEVTKTKILDAIEADIARLKTIITEAEMIKAIQAHLDFAEIKTALIDKAFITQILSDETFRQQFEAGEVTTQNIFTKMRDSIQSSIKKEFITKEETKRLVNDLTIGADGIRQITQEETNKIIDNRKTELKGKDGTNSYIHTKYSNNANGQPMSDNSNSKYIGIYTGTSKTPPTNASEYSWTLIKGVDGKLPNFNLLIDSEIKDENSFKTNGGIYRLNKGDYNGKNSIEIINNNISSNVASLGVYFRSSKTSFKNGDKAVLRLPMYIYSDIPIDNGAFVVIKNEKTNAVAYALSITNSMPRDKWFIIEEKLQAYRDFDSTDDYIFKIYTNKNGHFKIAEPYFALGDEIPKEWVPSLADLNTHSLTASVRINGSYEGAKTSSVKFFVEVFYDGKKVTDGFKLTAKVQGAGLNKIQENATYNSTGELTNVYYSDGDKDGTPITIQLDVEYNYTKTTCFARLDNLPSPELISDVVKKYKTFESTLETFKSKIGEVDTKKFKLAYNIENICSESGVEKKGNDLYFNVKTPIKANKEYYVLADLDDVPENQDTRIYSARDGGDSKKVVSGLNIWRISFTSDQTRVNIYPLGSNTKVKNVEIYEVPEFEPIKDTIISKINDDKITINFLTKNTIKKNGIYTLTFNAEGVSGKKIGFIYNSMGSYTKKPLVNGLNTWTFRAFQETNYIQFPLSNDGTVGKITNIKCVEERFNIGYKTEFNISTVFSEIEQTKNQFRTAVTENNFGTVLTQNAQYLRLAWNNISKYIQFENAGMSFYEGGQVNDNKLVARLNDSGYQMWRDGYYLGSIGTNKFKRDESKKGIQFDLEYDGAFMGWAYRTSRTADAYSWKWVYSASSFGGFSSDTINAGCNVDLHNNELRNAIIKSDAITVWDGVNSTFRFALPTSFQDDGRAYQWHDDCYLKFRNGLLIDSSMPT